MVAALVLGLPTVVIVALGIWTLRLDAQLGARQRVEQAELAAKLAASELEAALAVWERAASRVADAPACTPDAIDAPIAAVLSRPAAGFVVCVDTTGLHVFPERRLVFVPGRAGATMEQAFPPDAISAIERVEFQPGQARAAADLYQKLVDTTSGTRDPVVKTWALQRLARSLAKAGDVNAAIAAYGRLETMTGTVIGSLPADLVGLTEGCALVAKGPNQNALASCALHMLEKLAEGTWNLDPIRYRYYSDQARLWAKRGDRADAALKSRLEREAHARTLAEAADAIIADLGSDRRERANPLTVADSDLIVFVTRRQPTSERLAIVAVASAVLESDVWRRRAESALQAGWEWSLHRKDGSVVFPLSTASPAVGTNRMPASAITREPVSQATAPLMGGAWQIHVRSAGGTPTDSGAVRRRWILGSSLIVMVVAVLFGGVLGLRAFNEQVRVARVKSEFVSAVSHEFRSPLTGICHLADLLDRGRVSTEDRRREYYRMILDEGHRLTRLVDNVLDFARMEEGRKPYRREPIAGVEWIRGVVTEFERSASARGKRVSLALGADGPALVGDVDALGNALWNLLDNAAKYSPDSDDIRVEAVTDPSGLRIEVVDSGVGIAEADQTRVFERFYRAGPLAESVQGTGLGLSLVKHIVDAHQGRIELSSATGSGTRVSVWLPASEAITQDG